MSDTSPAPDSGDLMSMTPLEARFWTVRRLAGLLGVALLIAVTTIALGSSCASCSSCLRLIWT